MNTSRLSTQSAVGIVVVVLGLLLLLGTLGVTGIGTVIRWVPSLFIAYGVWRLVSNKFVRPLGPVIIIVIASFIQLAVLGISIGSLWPLILIIIGLAIIFGQRGFRKSDGQVSEDSDSVNVVGVLGSTKRLSAAQAFKGGQVTSVLGEVEIDLRGATMADGPVTLEVTSILGEVKLKVPSQWSVNVENATLLGDTDDDRDHANTSERDSPTLNVTGLVLLGSLKIMD